MNRRKLPIFIDETLGLGLLLQVVVRGIPACLLVVLLPL